MIKYHAFIKTLELGSITKAAQLLGYSQPGLSHIINSFEDEVGFPLFLRTKASIVPTDDARRLVPYCLNLIQAETELNNTIDSINGITTGTIRIGAPYSLLMDFVPRVVEKFTTAYPDVEVYIHEDTLEGTRKNLQNGGIDVGFLTDVTSKSFKFYTLFEDEICLAMSKHHPLASHETIPLHLLKNYAFISPPAGWDDISSVVFRSLPFTPIIKSYSASDVAGLAMVSSNMGMYVISTLHIPALPENVVVKSFNESFSRIIGISLKSLKTATPVQKEFLRVTREESCKGSVKP